VAPAPLVRTNPPSAGKPISGMPTPNSASTPVQGVQAVIPPAQLTAPEQHRDANRPGFIPPPARAQNPSGMTPYRQPQPAAPDATQRSPGAFTPPPRAPEAAPQPRPNWRSQQAPIPERPTGGYGRALAPQTNAPAVPSPSRSMEAPRAPRQEVRAPSRNDGGAGRSGGQRGME
jgi:hypothetical protein